jgi:hypothetical protein
MRYDFPPTTRLPCEDAHNYLYHYLYGLPMYNGCIDSVFVVYLFIRFLIYLFYANLVVTITVHSLSRGFLFLAL